MTMMIIANEACCVVVRHNLTLRDGMSEKENPDDCIWTPTSAVASRIHHEDQESFTINISFTINRITKRSILYIERRHGSSVIPS